MDIDNVKRVLLESRKEAGELLARAEKAERERDEALAMVFEMRAALDYLGRREVACQRYKDDDAVPRRTCINTGHPERCEGCVSLWVANIFPEEAIARQRARRAVVEAAKALAHVTGRTQIHIIEASINAQALLKSKVEELEKMGG